MCTNLYQEYIKFNISNLRIIKITHTGNALIFLIIFNPRNYFEKSKKFTILHISLFFYHII